MPDWSYETDLLVVGSGGAGMAAATVGHDLGLETLIIEKTAKVGGTTAVSAGGFWTPCNHKMAAQGEADSYQDALTYMQATVGDQVDGSLLEAFLQAAPRMALYLEENTQQEFSTVSLPDYHAEKPGGRTGHRLLEAVALDATLLDRNDLKLIRLPHPQFDMKLSFNTYDFRVLASMHPGSTKIIVKAVLQYVFDFPWRFRSFRSRWLTLGNALIGRFMLSIRERKLPLWTNTALTELLTDGERIIGVKAVREGEPITIKVRKGVLIAAGGFNSNAEMRAEYMPNSANPDWSVVPFDALTGDGIQAGIQVGAATHLMDEAWWMPAIPQPDKESSRGVFLERSLPGSIIVDQNAERYFNESINYDDAGRAIVKAIGQGRPASPSFFIFDGSFRRKYAGGPLMAGKMQPDWMVSSDIWKTVYKASTLSELATKIGLSPAALQATVDRHNVFAGTGKDEDFGRGDHIYDGYYSDSYVKPNPNLAPIEKAPYYAIAIYPGDIGTKGGLLIDAHARVLDSDGNAIVGLYAAGNSSASIMGEGYPGGGSTIGAAMTFGFIAAEHIAGRQV